MIQRNESLSRQQEIMQLLQNTLGKENVYLEIIAQDYQKEPQLEAINNAVTQLAHSMQIPLLVSNNSHYIKPEDKIAAETALSIKDNTKMYDDHRRKILGDYHLFSEEELDRTLIKNGYDTTTIEDMKTNNNTLAERVHIDLDIGKPLFPIYETPDAIAQLYKTQEKGLISND